MKISVLIPTLGKREKELNRLLNSLENQLYKKFEIIIVSQDNHIKVKNIIDNHNELYFKHIKLKEKGLSKARNAGLEVADGEIVILSDDDCWYMEDSFYNISRLFEENPKTEVILTQIYDWDRKELYKKYPKRKEIIKNKLQLMSKSSIEIAYRKEKVKCNYFDEKFGLGSKFVCGEEVDFLLQNFEKGSILYVPLKTVYHKKKSSVYEKKQIVAKGALYRKNYNIIICSLVLLRDFFLKKENNTKNFLKGYKEYRGEK